jgi:curved DNA-binding protein CbpA
MSLDERVDIPHTLRARIEEVHARLDAMTHYELLGVATNADKRTISRAYLERTLEFQSARYFGRSLGVYRMLMDRIYGRVAIAHDTLVLPQKRAEYDAELRRARIANVEQMLEDEARAMRGAQEEARTERIASPPVRTQSGTRPVVRVPPRPTVKASSSK